MNQTLYLECNAGISGDMTVGALVDLGVDKTYLQETLMSLPITGFHTVITRVNKSGLDACDFNVVLDRELDNHDHDMEYLHGLLHAKTGKESATTHGSRGNYLEQMADHANEADYGAKEHDHAHRSRKEVVDIIRASKMTPRAKDLAEKIFTILAEAEAKVHGKTPETVMLHEVGAVDSIVDIAAVAICLDYLEIRDVIVPVLKEGTGTIRCAHGILPVPVPAVSAIASGYELPLSIMPIEGEFVTPTGAAIVAAICTGHELPAQMTIHKIGLGAGKRNYERPSLLRAMIISPVQKEMDWERIPVGENTFEARDSIVKLETDIDDCTGEALGFLMEELMKAGAKDVHYAPVFMKKDRPAYELTVLCMEEERTILEDIIFRNTTTIGIRRCKMERTVLPRKSRTVLTPYGDVRVKVVTLPSGEVRSYPEYEDIATICRAYGLGYTQVYQAIVFAADEEL